MTVEVINDIIYDTAKAKLLGEAKRCPSLYPLIKRQTCRLYRGENGTYFWEIEGAPGFWGTPSPGIWPSGYDRECGITPATGAYRWLVDTGNPVDMADFPDLKGA